LDFSDSFHRLIARDNQSRHSFHLTRRANHPHKFTIARIFENPAADNSAVGFFGRRNPATFKACATVEGPKRCRA
jgi:hypothetical protein